MAKKRIGIMLDLMWPYRRHIDVFAGTQRFAQEHGGWECEIDELHEKANHRGLSQAEKYDGMIARATDRLATSAMRAKIPLVNTWLSSPAASKLPGVFPDFGKIGADAARHVHERGFRQFGCVANPRTRSHHLMTQAFHEELKQQGCRCNCTSVSIHYYRTQNSWAKFQAILDKAISNWTTPIALLVAFNDVTIRYIVHACQRHGLRVPEDVALIGATNEPRIGELPPPSLTSLEVSYEQLGYQAAQMLDKLIKRKKLPQQHLLIPPSGVIARDSTDFFAVDDPVVAIAMRHIEKHANTNLSVDDVVAAAGVSRRTLERRFRDSSGRSIAKEIRRLRILKAKRLMAETDMLVKQIARETGFRDPIRLHEVFVREEGQTPTEYRREVRGE